MLFLGIFRLKCVISKFLEFPLKTLKSYEKAQFGGKKVFKNT